MLLTGILGASAAIKGAKIGNSIMSSTKDIKEKTGKAKEKNAVMDKYKASHPGEKQNTLVKRHGFRNEFANNNGVLSDKSKKTMNKMGLTEQDLVRPRNDAEIAADEKKAEREAKAAQKGKIKGDVSLFAVPNPKTKTQLPGMIGGKAKNPFVKGFQKYAEDNLDDYGMAVLRQKDAAKAKAAESAKSKKDREAVLRAKMAKKDQIGKHIAKLNQMKAALPASKNKLADKKRIAAYEAMIKKQFGL